LAAMLINAMETAASSPLRNDLLAGHLDLVAALVVGVARLVS
jgi:hypothetical protein